MGKLGVPQGRSGRVRKISPGPECDPRTVQPVSSRYIDCAVRVHLARVEERIIWPPPGTELLFLGYVACSEVSPALCVSWAVNIYWVDRNVFGFTTPEGSSSFEPPIGRWRRWCLCLGSVLGWLGGCCSVRAALLVAGHARRHSLRVVLLLRRLLTPARSRQSPTQTKKCFSSKKKFFLYFGVGCLHDAVLC